MCAAGDRKPQALLSSCGGRVELGGGAVRHGVWLFSFPRKQQPGAVSANRVGQVRVPGLHVKRMPRAGAPDADRGCLPAHNPR